APPPRPPPPRARPRPRPGWRRRRRPAAGRPGHPAGARGRPVPWGGPALRCESASFGRRRAARHAERPAGRRADAARSGDRRALAGRPAPHRHRRQHPPLGHDAGRHAPTGLPRRAALPRARLGGRRAPLHRRRGLPHRGAGHPHARGRGALPQPEAPSRGGVAAPAAGAGRAGRHGAGAGLARRARRPRLGLPGRAAGREAGNPGNGRSCRAARPGFAFARAAHRGVALVRRDRPADAREPRPAPTRGAVARADGVHPAPARRGRGEIRRDQGADGGRRQGRDAAGGGGGGAPGAAPAGADAGGFARARHGPHLPGLADRAALAAAGGAADRHRRSAPHPRRGPFRAGADQEAHHRIPGGAQARAGGQGADPVLRRAAGRGQDLARPVHRPRHGPGLRARVARRRPRRSGNPRPPPHLHRRAARQHRPGHPQGRRAELRDDAGRDRQDGAGRPGRPLGRHAGGAGPRAERHLPRQLPRRALRPVARGLHRHRQHAGHHPGAAARPDGDHRPQRLHRRGEAADRAALPRAPPIGGQRRHPGAGGAGRRRAASGHPILHPRGRRPRPGARDRPRHAQRRRADRRGQRGARPHRCGGPCRDPRRAALRERSGDAHLRAGRGDGPGLDPGGRRHPVHRGDAHPRIRQAHPHRPARRRHARERASGAEPGEEPGRFHRRGPRVVREVRHPHPRSRRRDAQGRAERRRGDVHRARLLADRSHGAERHCHDRRDQPARAGAAGGRDQGEGGRGGAGRARARAAAGPQPPRLRGDPGGRPRAAGVHLAGARGGRRVRRARRAAGRLRACLGARPWRGRGRPPL
ncbi:MAG: ATP-dependent protease La Type I, partial [uncultured Acetobacteraceae bacterium]